MHSANTARLGILSFWLWSCCSQFGPGGTARTATGGEGSRKPTRPTATAVPHIRLTMVFDLLVSSALAPPPSADSRRRLTGLLGPGRRRLATSGMLATAATAATAT